MVQQSSDLPVDFIPARENRLFIAIFRWYVRWLFSRKFDALWLRQIYEPTADESTIYFLNHTSWWDGLIPFLLNEFHFHQHARAVMEDQQMREFPFFSRIGAFSINRSNPRSALQSLRYGLDYLQQSGRSLFIYPEGKIIPPEQSPTSFEGGLAWMLDQITSNSRNSIRVVPIGIYTHLMDSARPTLLLNVAAPVAVEPGADRTQIQAVLEHRLSQAVLFNRQYSQRPEQQFDLL
ncbi:MAG: lysophospholipid acyltransferase family protein [Bacteroidota bacterium]